GSIAAKCRAVTVIHGGGIDAAMLLAITACVVPATVGRTTATPPPVSPSSTGGSSGSCIHIVLVCILHSVRPEGGRESAFLTCRRSLDGALCHAQSTCAETPIQVEFSLENLCPLGARSQWARSASELASVDKAGAEGWQHRIIPP